MLWPKLQAQYNDSKWSLSKQSTKKKNDVQYLAQTIRMDC